MGFRAALFGFVLLLSAGNLGFTAQNWVIFGTNETLHQTKGPEPPVTRSSHQHHQQQQQQQQEQGNQTEQKHHAPVTYRLKTYQLQNLSTHFTKQKLLVVEPTSQPATAFKPTSELKKTVQAEKAFLVHTLDQNLSTTEPPKKESKVEEQRVPAPAQSVLVRCGEEKVIVGVKQDFLGNGQLIRPSDLTLGGCEAFDMVDQIVLFQAELHGCGSSVLMTEASLIYTFTLMYSPTPIANTTILRTNPAEATVQCHFRRRNFASSDAIRPTWTTFASKMSSERQFRLSLRLMTEDWLLPRPSNSYVLRDVIHMEASVLQGFHIPLRVFVDHCVATVNPDPNSQIRYPFISNHGCLTDAKLTGAESYFMQRSQEDKLHLQLKAFKFQQDDRNSVYITCHLKAMPLYHPIDTRHKACSYLTEANRWVASGGDNNVCSCCETSCGGQRQKRSLAADAALRWEETSALDPIMIEDDLLPEELPPELILQPQMQEDTQDASSSSTALLA